MTSSSFQFLHYYKVVWAWTMPKWTYHSLHSQICTSFHITFIQRSCPIPHVFSIPPLIAILPIFIYLFNALFRSTIGFCHISHSPPCHSFSHHLFTMCFLHHFLFFFLHTFPFYSIPTPLIFSLSSICIYPLSFHHIIMSLSLNCSVYLHLDQPVFYFCMTPLTIVPFSVHGHWSQGPIHPSVHQND